jgi:hypothetical protein
MQTAIVLALAAVLFSCMYLGFRTGLRLGMQTAKGQIPPRVDPVGAVMQKVADVKQTGAQNDLLKGFANMMKHDGYPPEER